MVFKNSKSIFIAIAALLVITVSFLLYLTNDTPLNKLGNGNKIVESIDIQNNALTNYVNSIYNSQVTSIQQRYSAGEISNEEMDKQLNAVIKNREITLNTLNKLEKAKKDIFTGNITRQDILIRINSFDDFDSDIKAEINATLNGYDESVSDPSQI